jgi:phosphopantothenoylcysteine synthetase/decarboxylase
MKVLITSGGTEEKIDGVRSLTNFSTGRTGAVIADYFADRGAEVTLLHAEKAVLPLSRQIARIKFLTFNDLDKAIKGLLSQISFDAVIHTAAVSDFSVDYLIVNGQRFEPGVGKIDSGRTDDFSIHLRPNHKIVSRLREYSINQKVIIVGFKLTNTADEKVIENACLKLWQNSPIDFLVHNDLSQITAAGHYARIFCKDGSFTQLHAKVEIAEKLYQLIGDANDTLS